MTEWYPITAKFTSDEKRVLDAFRDVYGLNYNKSLRNGLELFARQMVAVEYFQSLDSKILKKVRKISSKHMRAMDTEITEMLMDYSKKQQDAEYEKLAKGLSAIFLEFDNIFVKNRKIGRKKLPRKRGRSSSRL